MKLSVSIPQEDVNLLDAHARKSRLASRSAALHDAIRLLRYADLDDDYRAAFEAWDATGERRAWEGVTGDGLP